MCFSSWPQVCRPSFEFFINTLDAVRQGKGEGKSVATIADKVTAAWITGEDIYFLTYADAPRYKAHACQGGEPRFC